MEFLRVFLVFGISIALAEDLTLRAISIPHQNIQNFFHSQASSEISVEMILNHKVKINGKWYKKGDKLSKYQIEAIKDDSVILRDSKNALVVPIFRKSDFLKNQPSKNKPATISLTKNSNKGE